MKTELELATERARAYVRNRGWRQESLTWEEVKELLGELDRIRVQAWLECED